MTDAFLTGSYAYGTPHEKSDIDLVVMMAAQELEHLIAMADTSQPVHQHSKRYPSVSLRFGKLNLIVCSDEADYMIWLDGTDQLTAKRPVTREVAVELFTKLRNEKGNP